MDIFFTDLLFMEGIETVFRVALVLLKTHEEALLSCETFEQIMEYMKTSMSSMPVHQIGHIISQVLELFCGWSRGSEVSHIIVTIVHVTD